VQEPPPIGLQTRILKRHPTNWLRSMRAFCHPLVCARAPRCPPTMKEEGTGAEREKSDVAPEPTDSFAGRPVATCASLAARQPKFRLLWRTVILSQPGTALRTLTEPYTDQLDPLVGTGTIGGTKYSVTAAFVYEGSNSSSGAKPCAPELSCRCPSSRPNSFRHQPGQTSNCARHSDVPYARCALSHNTRPMSYRIAEGADRRDQALLRVQSLFVGPLASSMPVTGGQYDTSAV